MVRQQLNDLTETVINTIDDMNEKLKFNKKQLKKLNKIDINDEYINSENVIREKEDLINIIDMLKLDLKNYKKVLYRLNVIKELLK